MVFKNSTDWTEKLPDTLLLERTLNRITKKRELSKNTVLKFNETVKANITEEKLQNFMEVAEVINELITDKKIFNDK